MTYKSKENYLRVKELVVEGSLKVNGNAVSGGVALGEEEVIDLNGIADGLILDADADTTISAPSDDQIDIELKSVDHIVLKAVAVADAGATTNIQEIAFTAPVDTTGTNEHNGLNIDIEVSNSTGGTNTVNAIKIDNITGDAQVTATSLLVGTGFDIGVDMQGTKLELDADNDTSIIASTDDQIDFEVAGALDFRMTANLFTALAGSTFAGSLRHAVQALTATGAITIDSGLVTLAHATVIIAATLDAPTAGDFLIITNTSASGTVAHTVTLTGVTYNGTNTIATFDAPGETLVLVAVSAAR